MTGSGPRDWSPMDPPRYGERIEGWSPAPPPKDRPTARGRSRRGFARGLGLSLIVIPPTVIAWVALRELGVITSLIAWGAAVLAVGLYRWGPVA